MRNQGGTGDDLVSPVLKKTQKGLPQFVTSHLLNQLQSVPRLLEGSQQIQMKIADVPWGAIFTLLILEGASFNVN